MTVLRRVNVVLYLCIALTIFILVFTWITLKDSSEENSTTQPLVIRDEISRLEQLFAHESSEEAYRIFAGTYHDARVYEAYDVAHVVGTILYKKHGKDGMRYCDASYGGGCFRGFFLQKFLTEKELSISLCAHVPEDMRNQCFMGLGHGLLVVGGYTIPGIEQALAACETLDNWYSACAGGVFTEYNTQRSSQLMQGTRHALTLDKEKLYEPCILLRQKYQADCFIDQPPRWFVHISTDPQKIASLCEAIQNDANKLVCFRGIARITPHGITDISYRMSNFCGAIAHKAGRIMCEEELNGH
jgi:hypothetical protein